MLSSGITNFLLSLCHEDSGQLLQRSDVALAKLASSSLRCDTVVRMGQVSLNAIVSFRAPRSLSLYIHIVPPAVFCCAGSKWEHIAFHLGMQKVECIDLYQEVLRQFCDSDYALLSRHVDVCRVAEVRPLLAPTVAVLVLPPPPPPPPPPPTHRVILV
jgi:hypothetical protein